MNRKELATAIAEDLGTDRRAADSFLGSLVGVITETVATGEPVVINGLPSSPGSSAPPAWAAIPRPEKRSRLRRPGRPGIRSFKAFKDAVLASKKKR